MTINLFDKTIVEIVHGIAIIEGAVGISSNGINYKRFQRIDVRKNNHGINDLPGYGIEIALVPGIKCRD